MTNSLWPTLAPYLANADTLAADRLGTNPDRDQLSAALAARLQGLSVAKVKLYDLNGRTIFSTEAAEIGDGHERQRRLSGRPLRQRRQRTDSPRRAGGDERDSKSGDLLSTYIPVRQPADGAIRAVFEIYDDVTPFLARVERTQWMVMLAVFAILCVLYGVLFVIVRHADGVIQRQYRQRDAAERALRRAQHTLEQRVEARTAELARANAGLQAEIGERRLADQRVVHMAHHDALTGLPNRTLLADRLGQAIARAHRRGGKLAVLFLDLDRFKNVNDSLGHASATCC